MRFSERQEASVEAWVDYCASTHRHTETCPRPVVFDSGFHMGGIWAARRARRGDLRERVKLAIQTAQDQDGRLLYVIPPGVAGMYADAILRVLSVEPYPESEGRES